MQYYDRNTGQWRTLNVQDEEHERRRREYWANGNATRRNTYMMAYMRNRMRQHGAAYEVFRAYMNNPQMLQWRRNRRYAEEDRERFGANSMGMHRYYGPGYWQPR